jgi:hypothetical protein
VHLRDALPHLLSRQDIKRHRLARHVIAVALRFVGGALFWISGGPQWLGRQLMWVSGRANGAAYEVERDR